MYRMLTESGYRAANGHVFSDADAERYNKIQRRINVWMKERRQVPETLLNESHKTFCLITGMNGC